jgi:DNA-binding NtrC family response regulator
MIEDALRSNGANLSKAARSLGLSRHGLRNKMARYNISREMLP